MTDSHLLEIAAIGDNAATIMMAGQDASKLANELIRLRGVMALVDRWADAMAKIDTPVPLQFFAAMIEVDQVERELLTHVTALRAAP